MSKGSVLFVEDNPDSRVLIRLVLESEDYLVFEPEIARAALDHLETHKPDLILMDINMPENGFLIGSITIPIQQKGVTIGTLDK